MPDGVGYVGRGQRPQHTERTESRAARAKHEATARARKDDAAAIVSVSPEARAVAAAERPERGCEADGVSENVEKLRQEEQRAAAERTTQRSAKRDGVSVRI